MTTADILNFSGLILNVIGSLILTFSLSKYLTSIHGALAIHDIQLRGILNRDEKVLTGDIANLLKTGVENSRVKTVIGLVIVIIGFVLQVIPCILNFLSKTGKA